MILLVYILFILAVFIGIPVLLVRTVIRTFKKKGKKTGFITLFLTLGLLYAGFHYMTFEAQHILPSWDCKWTCSIKNESSVKNPKVLLEFKKMYVKYKIDLADHHNETEFDGKEYMGGSFYTKNVGYEFNRAIVPKGIKAEVVCNFDYQLAIVLKDDTGE
ncbi:hypothetical protein [Treponema zioleckii]|uniref:hypothetical protein n=1 Tax=Treponema zioleckii TaxID=331680 RepID=UPI00168BE15C|nr:hypothetical protein [Treponema zioleckii]